MEAMDCAQVREALSARMDGESLPGDPGPGDLDRHLLACGDCRDWLRDAEAVGRVLGAGAGADVPDLSAWIVADLVSPEVRRKKLAVRAALVIVAAAQLAVCVPVLVLGHDREAPVHVAHEMGSFGVAVAIGLLVAALQPRRAGGMLVVIAVAAVGLVVTAAVDVLHGATTFSDEVPHLLVVAGAVLLFGLDRLESAPPAGYGGRTALVPTRAATGTTPAAGFLQPTGPSKSFGRRPRKAA